MAEAALSPLPPLPIGAERAQQRRLVGHALPDRHRVGSLFAYLLFSYFYIALQRGPAWLPEPHPSLALAGPDTLVLLASSVAVWWGEQGVKQPGAASICRASASPSCWAWCSWWCRASSGRPSRSGSAVSSYGSLFFTITGFHMAHVIVGVLTCWRSFLWSVLGYFSPRHHARMTIASVYWHFVDVVWLFVFSTFYLSPYVMG